MTIIAYRYETKKSKVQHLRAQQTVFSEAVKQRLERVGSPARWVPEAASWDWPLTATAALALQEAAVELGEQIEWRDGLQDFIAAHLKQEEIEQQTRLAMERIIRDPKIPLEVYPRIEVHPQTGIPCPPMRIQEIAYHWALRVGGLYLAWEPGCGKSRAAADAIGGFYRTGQVKVMQPAFFDGKPGVLYGALIVCPKTMLRTWQRELAQWQNMSSVIITGGDATKKKRMAGTIAHCHLCNYESLAYVEHNHYSVLCLDEIHRCANSTSQTDRALALSQRASKRIGLSGTPITNALESIYYQLLIIDQGRSLGPSRTRFMEKYFYTETGRGGFTKNIPKDDTLEKVSAAMARSTFFVKKSDVLDLPEKTHTPIYLEFEEEQARYYAELERDAVLYIQDGVIEAEQLQAKMMKLAQLCQGFVLDAEGNARHFSDAKTKALMELLTGELIGKKVIVWTYFQFESKRIGELLRAAQIPYVRIDGTITSQRERDAAMDRFNQDPNLLIFVRQLSMSEGVTLLANESGNPCHETIYMGLSYRLVDWKQSQDRNHRYGAKFPVSYRYLLTESGIDTKIYNSVLNKSEVAEAVKEEGKAFYASLLGRK